MAENVRTTVGHDQLHVQEAIYRFERTLDKEKNPCGYIAPGRPMTASFRSAVLSLQEDVFEWTLPRKSASFASLLNWSLNRLSHEYTSNRRLPYHSLKWATGLFS